jgi:cell division protein FtsL
MLSTGEPRTDLADPVHVGSLQLNTAGVVYTAHRGRRMIRTVEAVIDEQGNVRLIEPVQLPSPRRALVTILEDRQVVSALETAMLSEASLAEDWNRPEEDEAWNHLQQVS